MVFAWQIYAFFIPGLLQFAVREVSALKYVSVDSGDDNFKLQWSYNNSKLIFNMTCKTTGWCGVGFTTTADGAGMVNYDIAVGGVASNTPYLNDYWSVNTGAYGPPKDGTDNWNLIKASEADGYSNVEFDRDTTTGDSAKDVQFMNATKVWILWALHSSLEANSGLTKHTAKGRISPNKQHNLIMEAMSAGIQPSATMMMPSAPSSGPSTVSSVLSPSSSVPSVSNTVPTTTSAASGKTEPRVMACAILALSAFVLSF